MKMVLNFIIFILERKLIHMPTTPMRFPVAADIFRQHRERVCKDREYGPESIADNPAVGIRYDTYVTKKRIVSFINL